MMKACESYEMHISALIDGEASRADTLAILDHLPTCASCQAFYRDCRELQDVADSMPIDAGEKHAPEPVEVGGAVGSSNAGARVVRFPRPARWVWAAAASVALLFVAGSIGLRSGSDADTNSRGAHVIDLSEQAPSAPMDDERFMEISVALLHAQPRYQRTMIEILERFERSRGLDESSIDVASANSESDEPWTRDEFEEDDTRWPGNATPQP